MHDSSKVGWLLMTYRNIRDTKVTETMNTSLTEERLTNSKSAREKHAIITLKKILIGA